jgi:nitronate monooxygenase
MTVTSYPMIIQGGMGIAVSGWNLARAVSVNGGLGVVSGTGIAYMLIAELADGDPTGRRRRALAAFPDADAANAILERYFVEGGKPADKPYLRPAMWTLNPPKELEQLTAISAFTEVWLAKEGHDNPVGINLLEKLQLSNLASLYGAMVAGVDVVIMGAGIPMQIPGALDAFSTHQAADYPVDVSGAEETINITFDPSATFNGMTEPLKRPDFFPIVSSVVLAKALLKRANGRVDGFIVELPIAGGHNAPPRGDVQYNDAGEPVYGKRDEVNAAQMAKLGLPFWMAGGYANPEAVQSALDAGAQGVQIGTAFAYCDESGMAVSVRERVIGQVLEGDVHVHTSATASPTGFPFKVVGVSGTVSDDDVYNARPRNCDMGYLRSAHQTDDGKIVFRCAAEPVNAYVNKGGDASDTENRVCLCNQLAAAADIPQVRRGGYVEPMIVTSGDDLPNITRFMADGATRYSAADVLAALMPVREPLNE